jgi:phosphoribosylformylglycinamidine cyclo-ligase
MSEKGAYAQAGVDVDIEAEASAIMYEASKQSFVNRKGKIGEIIAPFDDFSGIKMVDVSKLPEGSFFSVGFDTAGTKVEISQRVGKHDTIAFDLLAMVCDDALMRGGEPVLVGTNLDLRSLGTDDRYLPIVRELAKGYVEAAKAGNVSIINGEIVQMGPMVQGYGEFPYHWGAACIWFGRKDKILKGDEIKVGDAVVVLKENGFRCNGLSLVRKIFAQEHGENWYETAHDRSTLGLVALTPSIIYSRFVVGLHGGFDTDGSVEIHGVAHITGGGVREKMKRMLRPSGLGARLSNLFDPPSVMSYCQKIGGVSDVDAYGTWNMGQGLAIVTPEPDKIVAVSAAAGIEAKIAGEITKEPGITIVSHGVESPGKELHF